MTIRPRFGSLMTLIELYSQFVWLTEWPGLIRAGLLYGHFTCMTVMLRLGSLIMAIKFFSLFVWLTLRPGLISLMKTGAEIYCPVYIRNTYDSSFHHTLLYKMAGHSFQRYQALQPATSLIIRVGQYMPRTIQALQISVLVD